jgi:hypothetical protein
MVLVRFCCFHANAIGRGLREENEYNKALDQRKCEIADKSLEEREEKGKQWA